MRRAAVHPQVALGQARRHRLVGCALAVLLAHAGLLAAVQTPRSEAPRASANAMELRLVTASAARPAVANLFPRGADDTAGLVASERTTAGAPSAAMPPSSAANDDDVVYLPKVVLTSAPRAREPVNIAYPYFDGEAEAYTGEFELFIDDTGGVVRVVNTTPGMPGILVNAVREAFLAASFHPGEREGRAVRSRIRIEVTFDKGALGQS